MSRHESLSGQLEESIRADLARAQEYRDLLRDEADPNRRSQYRRSLEQWEASAAEGERKLAALRTGDEEVAAGGAGARPAGMPAGAVPEVAPLPAGSRLPLAPNPRFVGREPDLLALAEALWAGRAA